MLRSMQIGMNSLDLAGTLRLYSALGFSNAGGQTIWGELIRIQGLPPESRAIIWWMVGRQKSFQLEFFQHSQPMPRPLRDDWRPSDHGWTRFGLEVVDFDHCLAILRDFDIPLLSAPHVDSTGRRAAFRDPFIGVIVEVVEAKPEATGPAVLYAAASVGDLESARVFYSETLRLPIEPLPALDIPDETLWGLQGAQREGFLVQAGDIYLEISSYSQPVGRPRPTDYRLSDQGIVNVMLATHDMAEMRETFERLQAAGLKPPYMVRTEAVLAGYITDREREIELSALSPDMLPAIGFVPAPPFLDDALNPLSQGKR